METPYVIIPMAGFGKRFKDEGYAEEKPLIEVGTRTLLSWSLHAIPGEWTSRIVVILRPAQSSLRALAKASGFSVVEIPGPTQGAACTVLAAAVGLPPDAPVCVMNADQWFRIGTRILREWRPDGTPAPIGHEVANLDSVYRHADIFQWDGFILTFPGTGSAWSYAVTNGTNRVVHVIEKKEVSPYATVGVYWWRRAADLVRSICAMIAVGQKTNQEFYMAPAYNFLPLSDKRVEIVPVEEFMGLGTPEQVRAFEARLKGGWTP